MLKGFNYCIDSSLLKAKIGNEERTVSIFARNKNDLGQFLIILKQHNDKGSLKVINRKSSRNYVHETWDELYDSEMINLKKFLDKKKGE